MKTTGGSVLWLERRKGPPLLCHKGARWSAPLLDAASTPQDGGSALIEYLQLCFICLANALRSPSGSTVGGRPMKADAGSASEMVRIWCSHHDLYDEPQRRCSEDLPPCQNREEVFQDMKDGPQLQLICMFLLLQGPGGSDGPALPDCAAPCQG